MNYPDYPTALTPEELAFSNIIYTKQAGVATVTINRESVLNATDFHTLKEMARAFEDASYDDRSACWCSPARATAPSAPAPTCTSRSKFLTRRADYWKWMGAFIEAHDRLRNIGKPTIARLNGMVVGGGNEFNIACDLADRRRRHHHPPGGHVARLRARGRRDPVAADHHRRPPRPRNAVALRADPAPRPRWNGGWSTTWCPAPNSTRRSPRWPPSCSTRCPKSCATPS